MTTNTVQASLHLAVINSNVEEYDRKVRLECRLPDKTIGVVYMDSAAFVDFFAGKIVRVDVQIRNSKETP